MAKAKNSVWYGELDRFGYVLKVIGRTEEEVREALSKEYIKAYEDINGCDPREDLTYYHDDEQTYYDNAMEDINVWEATFGKVEWD